MLSAFGAWFVRVISGWLPIGSKPIGEWLGKIIWVVGIYFALVFISDKLFSNTKVTQKVSGTGSAVSNTNAPKAYVGCASLRVIQYYAEKQTTTKK